MSSPSENGGLVPGGLAALLLVLMLVSCGELTQPEERGDCTLDRVSERIIHARPPAPEELIELVEPYVATLKLDELEFTAEAELVLEGDGWIRPGNRSDGRPTVLILKPDGSQSATLSRRSPDGSVSVDHTVNAVGVWTYILEWELVGCRQVVSIEVRPPDQPK